MIYVQYIFHWNKSGQLRIPYPWWHRCPRISLIAQSSGVYGMWKYDHLWWRKESVTSLCTGMQQSNQRFPLL